MLNEAERILILTDNTGIEKAIQVAKPLKSQPSCLIMQIQPSSLNFTPIPSRIHLTHFPAHMTAAIPLLEDYKIASRLCGMEAPGFWEGSMANLLQEAGKAILQPYEKVLIFGTDAFISECKRYTDCLIK